MRASLFRMWSESRRFYLNITHSFSLSQLYLALDVTTRHELSLLLTREENMSFLEHLSEYRPSSIVDTLSQRMERGAAPQALADVKESVLIKILALSIPKSRERTLIEIIRIIKFEKEEVK